MYRIIGADLKEYGPISADELRAWIAQGRANAQTKAKLEGSDAWRSLRDFPEFAALFGAPTSNEPPPLVSPGGDGWMRTILERDYQVSIGDCFSRGWDLVIRHFWLLVGASFVTGLIQGAVPFLASVCVGGMFLLCLKLIRGQPAEFGDAFSGFTLAFLQLFLAGIVIAVLVSVGLLFCLLPGIYLAVAWKFAVPLVVDKKMEFWPAMELSRKVVSKHWWTMLGLLLVGALVVVLGFIACFVGVFVAIPVVLAAMAYAYEDIFGRAVSRPAGETTAPPAGFPT